jgi:hypothetical protein
LFLDFGNLFLDFDNFLLDYGGALFDYRKLLFDLGGLKSRLGSVKQNFITFALRFTNIKSKKKKLKYETTMSFSDTNILFLDCGLRNSKACLYVLSLPRTKSAFGLPERALAWAEA